MPIIKHLSGPQKGIWNVSDPGDERILIGRARDCDVDFPLDCLTVAERHLVLLLQATGEWMFEPVGDHYVSINGRPAKPGQIINFGDLFEIGQPGGPSFEFLPGEKDWDDDDTIEIEYAADEASSSLGDGRPPRRDESQ
jgi:hypothetical protein